MESKPSVVSVSEVLQDQHGKCLQAQQIAEAVGDRIDCCTYSQGYHTQPVYVCRTCTLKNGEVAGFCLGCSMNCHLDHDIVELWNKRNFRCDCGNPKFENFTCSLAPKPTPNEKNLYSDNFKGLYCYCKTEYDPDKDEMHQCTRCEDWFHHGCIKFPSPSPTDVETFLCQPCLKICKALLPHRLKIPEIESVIEETLGKRKREQNEPTVQPFKKRKTGEDDACCRREISDEEFAAVSELKGVFFPCGWTETLCDCKKCLTLLDEYQFKHLFDDPVEDINMMTVDETVPLERQYSTEAAATDLVGQLPPENTLNVIAEQQRFHAAIKEQLQNFVGTVTEIQMRDIIQAAKQKLALEDMGVA